MPSIVASGIGSGIDIKSIVEQLVAAERQPMQNRLNLQESRTTAQLSAFGKLKGVLSGLRDVLADLTNRKDLQRRTSASSHEDILQATASNGAPIGGFPVEVISLASAHRLASAAFADGDAQVGTGTLTIESGEDSMSLTIDPGSDSLAAIRNAINLAPDNSGVTATLVNAVDGTHLVVSSDSTGADRAITITAAGGNGGLDALVYDPAGGTTNLTEQNAAVDAQISVDGFLVTSSSNEVSGAVEGLNFSLRQAQPGTIVTVQVTNDLAASKEMIQGFVDSYNDMLATFKELTAFDQDAGVAGELLGDSLMRGLGASMRREMGALSTGDDAFRLLADIGITMSVDGTVEVDDTALEEALVRDFDGVGALFAAEDGLAQRLDGLVGLYLDAGGQITSREESLRDVLDDIDDQRFALDARMEVVRRRYDSQFAAMDRLVAQLQSTGAFLLQQLGSG